MFTTRRARKHRSSGVASVLAMVCLAIFAAMAVAMFSAGVMGTAMAANARAEMGARMAAESGLSFLTRELTSCRSVACYRGAALLSHLGYQVSADLNGTANLGDANVTYNSSAITIPTIALDAASSFSARITLGDSNTVRLQVTGTYTTGSGAGLRTVQRQVSVDFHPTGNPAFGYGMVSNGPINIGMNENIWGVQSPLDGSIYSGAAGTAITIGSGYISGDVCYSAPGATVDLSGVTVDGTVGPVPPVALPAVDRSPYAPLATNIVDGNTSTASGTFTNIRIKANTGTPSSPLVFGSVTIRGVMYVEAPNNIEFTNDVNFTGVIVADDPNAGSPDAANTVVFKNNATFYGMDDLDSNTPHRAELLALQGTSVLAPGFTFDFKNNFGSVDGVIAVKNLTAKNNMTAVLCGTILAYGAIGIDLQNNNSMQVDRTVNSGVAPGFQGYGQVPLVMDPDTYTER